MKTDRTTATRPPMRYADFVVAGVFTSWLGMHLANFKGG